jgi:uncharacterized protein YhaN
MRINRLDLIAFGPFAGMRLDLGGRPGTLDLVYGPNEAGKSTTLRAISGLLFGIPHDTKDGHRHALTELRVGGRLEPAKGPALEVVRRKGRKDTLLDVDGKAIDDALLLPLLGGATVDLFKSMFGLDHQTLRSSAEDMLKGKGSVGESLFAAGTGAHGVNELRTRLREEAAALFTARGRDQKTIVRAIAEVRAAKKDVEDRSTSARGYLEQKRALEESVRERDVLRERRSALSTEQARLERLLAVSPPLGERARLLVEIAALGDAVRLPTDAPERRRAAVRELEEALQASRRTSEDIVRLEERLAKVVIPESLLSIDEATVREVTDQRGRHRAAEDDLPKVTIELGTLQNTVKKALAAVDPTLGLEDVERLRLGAAQGARIRNLAETKRGLDAESLRVKRELAAVSARRARLAERLISSLGPHHPINPNHFDRPSTLPMPGMAVLDLHAKALAALAAEDDRLARENERTEARSRAVSEELDALRRVADPPSEADLARARAERDASWRQARDGAGWTQKSLDAHERLVRDADEIADRLRREADRVAKHASLSAEASALTAEAGAVARRAGDVACRRVAEIEAFRERFVPCGIVPLAVEEMRGIVEQFGKLLETDEERARHEDAVHRLTAETEEWQGQWSRVGGLAGGTTPEEMLAVLEATSELLRQVGDMDKLVRRIDGMKRDSRRFTEVIVGLCREHLPDALPLSPADAAQRLVTAWEKARRDAAERAHLTEDLTRRKKALEAEGARERDARERVQALLAAARVTHLDDLEEAERRSDALRTRTAEKERVERRLAELGEGATIDELTAWTRGVDADHARARLSEVRDEIERITEARDDVVSRIATLEGGVVKLSEGAAEAAEDLSSLVARLKHGVHRYVRVRLASELLEREIERYREAHQGPIVERAAQLFPRLTLGRYVGLRVGFGENDDAVLRAVRQGAPDVGVESLSDGTRDALYLALRLASLERYAALNEPMPLVLDDALVHLDDDRARAALSVLGEVSERTQVVFFTHHARLRELAREALGEDGLSEHHLPAAS